MLNTPITRRSLLGLGAAGAAGLMFSGCATERADGKIEVEIVSYKQEAVSIFEQLMDEFNAAHDDIYLNITSPADAVTIMKTRFVREDYPDVIGIGGDADYASFVDSSILADVADCDTISKVSPAYQDILKSVTYVPWTASMACRMWPTPPVCSTTRTCSPRRAGPSPRLGTI